LLLGTIFDVTNPKKVGRNRRIGEADWRYCFRAVFSVERAVANAR